ncbi:GTP cyclohydrolase I [Microbacterium deminutum]|uniref:GTP cyclohydrolase 1 n=1 Tax=Microbacterium deminutum TaxID=344164 RepID=A0ABN2RBK3_9MICO
MTPNVAEHPIARLVPRETPGFDRDRAEAAVEDLLQALGHDTDDAHLGDTPRRVVSALREMLTPEEFSFTTFPNEAEYDEVVIVRGIRFTSLCSHHLLPFHGVADVGYVPGDRLVGLSKLARVVDWHARAPQVQERLTVQIAEELEERLAARGVGVVLRAEHICMSMRGARVSGTTTVTSAFRGELATDAAFRAHFRAAGMSDQEEPWRTS